MQSGFWLMISCPSSNASYFSVLFQENFFQIPASEILTNNSLQQKMQMTMNTLCPPGRKLGQIAIIFKKKGGGGRGAGEASFNLPLHMQSLRIQLMHGQNSEQRNAGVCKESSN